jgi:hypothetical protein
VPLTLTKAAAILALCALATAAAARAQTPHTVSLSWTASADAAANPSLTYNVYRSTGCSGPFVLMNNAPDSATTYLDAAVFAGTYCYLVTAVLSGVESVPSNQAAAAIPARAAQLPAAQASCVHRGTLIAWLRCVAALPRPQSKR